MIRNAEPPDSLDLAARRLGEHGMTLCASPAYLAEAGEPVTLAELPDHECIAYLRQGRCCRGGGRRPRHGARFSPEGGLQMDDLNAIPQAAIAGFGSPGCRPGWPPP